MTTNVLLPYVDKPWGGYQDYLRSDACVMKTIDVNPGAKLSLQSHEGRSEVWTVVLGVATVVLGETLETLKRHTLQVGESIEIPLTWIHRLQNETDTLIQVAEMQSGRCSETDIVRYEDDYNRKGTND